MKKLDIGVIVTTLIIVTISCSLAFFAARVVGEPKDINLVAKNVAITFNDTSIIANGVLSPGWNTTKTFTITNNSKEEYKYNISIKDLVNTFVTEGYLQYKITSTNGYNMIEFKDIPKSSAPKDKILAYSVSIPVGVTQSYTIEFKYANDESVDQSDDMGKKLSGTLFITEGTEQPTLLSQILNDNPTISERTDFSTVFTTNTANTLYKATENGIDVYYFAGVENIEEGCEYSGQKITDYSSNKLNENTCSGEIEVCHTDNNEYLYFGTSSCNGFDGSVEKIQVLWTSGVEKPLNNWVKFGKNSSNQDLYWRIIRTNSDGSIRLLYHGISTTATDAYIGESQFNKIFNDSMYVGYMYGTSGSQESNRTNANNSTIKTVIDNWYASNMTSYTKYLSTTAVYCNDREVGSGTYSATGSIFYYAPYARVYTSYAPTYDCTNNNDKFTVDASTGNGKLTYPIALMTADEIAYAGGATSKKAPMWYYTNSSFESSTGLTEWWSLSPFNWNVSGASSWRVFGKGSLSGFGVNYSRSVRPVVSLKSCIKYSTGNGTSETPYEIVETTSGC